jgi:hypothetical protein
MSSFRQYGGLNRAASNNIVRSQYSTSENPSITNFMGQWNSKIVSESHVDLSGNTLMGVQDIWFTNGIIFNGTQQSSTTGNFVVNGTLTVTGATMLQSTLSVSGAATLSSLGVTNNAIVGGTLGVTGTSTLAGTNATSLGVSGTLDVAGTSTLAVTNATSLDVSGTLDVAGTSTLAVTNATSLDVSGTLDVTGTSTLAGTNATSLDVSGNATVGGTLGVTGTSTLAVTNATSLDVSGTLDVTGTSTLAGTNATSLDVSGNATVGGTLGVTGAASAATFTSGSDYRIKENVQQLDNSFTIDNLNPVTYNNKISGKQDMGFIAHEVQEIFPFLVSGVKDGEETQTLNYIGLIAVLTKEIQDLKIRLNILESKSLL